MLRVHSMESFGTHEGPWIRFIVFLQWCLFRCMYCHNPDTIPLEWGTMMKNEEILEKLENMKPYFKNEWGLTVSGGEPLLQAEGLISLFKKAKENGINTALDTNWYVWNNYVEELVEYTDVVLLDVKHINNTWHKKITGKTNDNTLKFLKYLNTKNKKVWIRYVFVPGYSDQEEYLKEFWERLSQYTCIERVEILPYHDLWVYKWKELWWKYPLEGVPMPTTEQLDHALNIFKKYFSYVRLG